MKTFFAYLIVILMSQVLVTVGVIIASFLSNIFLKVNQRRSQSLLAGVLCGIAGIASAFSFSYWVFNLLAGEHSFGIIPALCCVAGMIIPMTNDYVRYEKLRSAQKLIENDNQLLAYAQIATSISKGTIIGYSIGIVLSGYFFLVYLGNNNF